MVNDRNKPHGLAGMILLDPNNVRWSVVPFPAKKAAREKFIADLFVRYSAICIRNQSMPLLGPFESPVQNEENDLDFTFQTPNGVALTELTEFAPLNAFGGGFANAPTSVTSEFLMIEAQNLIRKKSLRQGAAGRLLIVYTTEHAFELHPLALGRVDKRDSQTT